MYPMPVERQLTHGRSWKSASWPRGSAGNCRSSSGVCSAVWRAAWAVAGRHFVPREERLGILSAWHFYLAERRAIGDLLFDFAIPAVGVDARDFG